VTKLLGLLLAASLVCCPVLQAQTNHSVLLTWQSPSDFIPGDTYNVYRSSVSATGDVKMNLTGVTANSFTDLSVVTGATYYYVVTHVSSGSESPYSNEVRVLISPTAPQALSAILH